MMMKYSLFYNKLTTLDSRKAQREELSNFTLTRKGAQYAGFKSSLLFILNIN